VLRGCERLCRLVSEVICGVFVCFVQVHHLSSTYMTARRQSGVGATGTPGKMPVTPGCPSPFGGDSFHFDLPSTPVPEVNFPREWSIWHTQQKPVSPELSNKHCIHRRLPSFQEDELEEQARSFEHDRLGLELHKLQVRDGKCLCVTLLCRVVYLRALLLSCLRRRFVPSCLVDCRVH
jgi:hypothetical protein